MTRSRESQLEIAAGGVVVRRGAAGLEVALGEQTDRLTGAPTVRLPKGKLEPGETVDQAATREVLEESGLEARILSPLPRVSYHYGQGAEQVAKEVHFFLMEHVAGEPLPRDGEMKRVYWCPIERAARELTFDTERRAIEAARAVLAEDPTRGPR